MKTLCFYFQIHQPQRLKSYRFFNIGYDNYYYDDFANQNIMENVAKTSYIPANRMLLEMINESKGAFKCAFAISGIALEQMEIYAPDAIEGFKELAKTGCVEFLIEPFGSSLASLIDPTEFANQVEEYKTKIKELFDQTPKIFHNTDLIYSDDIAEMVVDLGFDAILTEGARQILGWKSPNYVYNSAVKPNLKLLLRNERFSEDISLRFADYTWNEYPLTADKYMGWIANTDENEKVFNLHFNYEVFGNFYKPSTGIFEFFKALPQYAAKQNIGFATPSEILKNDCVGSLSVTDPISWLDREKGMSAWLGNCFQQEAFHKLYALGERVRMSSSKALLKDWLYLQGSDNFYYMDTKSEMPFSPYASPFEAFSNYMNILSDFMERVYAEFPIEVEIEELNSLVATIRNQADEINLLQKELNELKKNNANS